MRGRLLSCLSGACSFQNNLIEIEPQHRKWRRVHGFELPIHPQQLLSWIIIIFIATFVYSIMIPDLPGACFLAFTVFTTVLLTVFLSFYITATIVDPAHPAVRAMKSKSPVPEFDREKHLHVIENGRCHLCNITVTNQRTKHCGICNKCVDGFDHHCRWLNQCIGKRNYLLFLGTVIASTISTLFIIGCSIYIIASLWSPQVYYTFQKFQPPMNESIIPALNLANATNYPEGILLDSATAQPPTAYFTTPQAAVIEDTTTIYLASQGPTTLADLAEADINSETIVTTIIPETPDDAVTEIISVTTTISSPKTKTFMGETSPSTLQLQQRDLGNNEEDMDSGNNETSQSNTTSSMLLKVSEIDASRGPKTILYAFVIVICVIAAGMLMHLLVFHMYICTKGLTTYEYLKPPIPQARLTSPPPRISRKGLDSANSSDGKSSSRMITSSSKGSALMSKKGGGANSDGGVAQDDVYSKKKAAGGDNEEPITQLSIEEESEAIWTTMTEIDLNAPSDFIGGTLPRNAAPLGANGGVLYEPSPIDFPTEENDLERINNEKNNTLNAMALAENNFLYQKDETNGKGKSKSKTKTYSASKEKAGSKSASGSRKTASSFSKKWSSLFGSGGGGSGNKVNPATDETVNPS